VRVSSRPLRTVLQSTHVSADEPTQIECPNCGAPVVLLPLKLYSGREDVDPNQVFDVAGHTMEAMFAIVDDEGLYRCPACQTQHRTAS
jgi:hypothetical protein